jgi:hypothetical protein
MVCIVRFVVVAERTILVRANISNAILALVGHDRYTDDASEQRARTSKHDACHVGADNVTSKERRSNRENLGRKQNRWQMQAHVDPKRCRFRGFFHNAQHKLQGPRLLNTCGPLELLLEETRSKSKKKGGFCCILDPGECKSGGISGVGPPTYPRGRSRLNFSLTLPEPGLVAQPNSKSGENVEFCRFGVRPVPTTDRSELHGMGNNADTIKVGKNGRFSRFQGPLRGRFCVFLTQFLRVPDRGRGLAARKHLGAHARRCSPTVWVQDGVDSGRPGAVVTRSFVKKALYTAEGCLQEKSAAQTSTKSLAAPLRRRRAGAGRRACPQGNEGGGSRRPGSLRGTVHQCFDPLGIERTRFPHAFLVVFKGFEEELRSNEIL